LKRSRRKQRLAKKREWWEDQAEKERNKRFDDFCRNIKQHREEQYKQGQKLVQYARRDRVLYQLGFSSYREYLNSQYWKAIRAAKMLNTPDCEICDRPATQVHHLDYSEETLRGRKEESLVSICGGCHLRLEFYLGCKTTPEETRILYKRQKKEISKLKAVMDKLGLDCRGRAK
jgi:hypothetical protein